MLTSYINGNDRRLLATGGAAPGGAAAGAAGIVSTGIYIFITAWNEYLFALTLTGRNVRTVTVAIQTLIGEFQIEWGLLAAGGVIGALPVTILFLIVQRRLVGGLTQGAVKG